MASSVEKGQRVIVTGRVRIRDWESGEKSGTTIEVDAESIGHDLSWGRSTFTRSVISAKGEGADAPASTDDTSTDAFAPSADDGEPMALGVTTADREFAASGASATPF